MVPHDHFNDFIDEIYSIKDGYEKLKINCMIGSLKPGDRENFKTLAIGTDPNVMYSHFLKANASFIEKFDINNTTYYHALEKFTTKSEESETPIYNMAVELEIINLYELCEEIQRLDGTVLDVNTDCTIGAFKNNVFPFTVNTDGNVEGYYFDDDKKVLKYKVEKDSERLKHQQLPIWKRNSEYEYKKPVWKTIEDVADNNFQPLIEQVLNSNESLNIDGRAGTGKSTFIKMLHIEMDKRNIKTLLVEQETEEEPEKDKRNYKYVSMAPTNKACRIIKGKTIHKFIASLNIKSFTEHKYDYIHIYVLMKYRWFKKYFINSLSICSAHFQL